MKQTGMKQTGIKKTGAKRADKTKTAMKKADRYLKIVEWSDEDQAYVGRVPGLAFGGVHGPDEARVYQELCQLVEDWVEILEKDGAPLPPATAGRSYSGKFNLRVSPELHERLFIESNKIGESLNQYCVRALQETAGLK